MGHKRTRHLHKHRARSSCRPPEVDEIADLLVALGAAFILFALVPGLGSIASIIRPENMASPTPFGIYFLFVLLLGLGLFHIYLATRFRRLERWTFGPVEFLVRWTNVFAFTGWRKAMERDDLRAAFGLPPLQEWERQARL